MNQRFFRLLSSIALTGALAASAAGQSAGNSSSGHPHILSVTAITEVFGDGQKITAAAVEYDKDIDAAKVSAADFQVADRTITKAYVNSAAAKAPQGKNGRYVILELSTADPAASILPPMGLLIPGKGGTGGPGGPQGQGPGQGPGRGGPPAGGMRGPKRRPVQVAVTQVGIVKTKGGETYRAVAGTIHNDKVINLIVDDFQQLVFHDPVNGNDVKYNLYVPKHYDRTKLYPMVMFMHDASVMSEEPDRTLIQGLGAVVWASPEDQARHPSFVLAPQLNGSLDQDESKTTPLFDSVYRLIQYVTSEYSIDKNRLYTTGQSAGCMASIAFDVNHPDLFAASLLVAGQWNAQLMANMIHQKLWIIVSEGDFRAYPGMNASIAVWEKEGAKITRGRWSAREPQDVQAANIAKMAAEHNNIMYTTYIKGTTLPPGEENSGAQEHMASWQFAYAIPSVRDWLFEQSKAPSQ